MEPFLGEIRLFGFDFAPRGWLPCNGALLSIASNQALFALLGTRYGGDGMHNFALPDLRGRSPLGTNGSSRYSQGAVGGMATHSLLPHEMPLHSHGLFAVPQASQLTPAGGQLSTPGKPAFAAPGSGGVAPMDQQTLSSVGASQPHENRPPYLALNFCIATAGIFPSRS